MPSDCHINNADGLLDRALSLDGCSFARTRTSHVNRSILKSGGSIGPVTGSQGPFR